MKAKDFTRPDKLLNNGLKILGSLGQNLYTSQRKAAKANAEIRYIGDKNEEVRSQLFTYSSKECEKTEDIQEFSFLQSTAKKTWLNFHGINDAELIQKVGNAIQLDRLTIRQILDTTQRPKFEDYDHYLFLNIKSILKGNSGELDVEQISLIVDGSNVITFQEKVGDHFENIRTKLVEGLGFIRKRKSDYLLVQLIDAILDNYFEAIDKINYDVAQIENQVFNTPHKGILIALEAHKRSAQIIKKALVPMKEAIVNLKNSPNTLITKDTRKNFNDIANTVSSILEEADSSQKSIEGLINIYFSSLSQNMNETMKVLTTVATIFIPLTFIAGIYGMNFKNMPELEHEYGYHITWGVIIMVAIGMIVYFKRKKWI